jgi:hypothetical protein
MPFGQQTHEVEGQPNLRVTLPHRIRPDHGTQNGRTLHCPRVEEVAGGPQGHKGRPGSVGRGVATPPRSARNHATAPDPRPRGAGGPAVQSMVMGNRSNWRNLVVDDGAMVWADDATKNPRSVASTETEPHQHVPICEPRPWRDNPDTGSRFDGSWRRCTRTQSRDPGLSQTPRSTAFVMAT